MKKIQNHSTILNAIILIPLLVLGTLSFVQAQTCMQNCQTRTNSLFAVLKDLNGNAVGTEEMLPNTRYFVSVYPRSTPSGYSYSITLYSVTNATLDDSGTKDVTSPSFQSGFIIKTPNIVSDNITITVGYNCYCDSNLQSSSPVTISVAIK